MVSMFNIYMKVSYYLYGSSFTLTTLVEVMKLLNVGKGVEIEEHLCAASGSVDCSSFQLSIHMHLRPIGSSLGR